MKLLLCGMNPHQGSIVGGAYFIIVGTMQMIFGFGHLRIARESINATGSPLLPRLCFDYYYSLLALESTTLLLSLCLLGAICAERHTGILGFAVWLMLYDMTLVVIISLIEVEMQAVGLKQNSLAWFGIVCRFVGDPFWLAFVITYGLEVRMKKAGVWQYIGDPRTTDGMALRLKFRGC